MVLKNLIKHFYNEKTSTYDFTVGNFLSSYELTTFGDETYEYLEGGGLKDCDGAEFGSDNELISTLPVGTRCASSNQRNCF